MRIHSYIKCLSSMLLAFLALAAIADDDTSNERRVALPLVLAPASDATFENLKTGKILGERQISHARTARLSSDLTFTGEYGSYSLKAGEPLFGLVVFGEWTEDYIHPNLLFRGGPFSRALNGEGTEPVEDPVKGKSGWDLLGDLSKGLRFETFDFPNLTDKDWMYCGTGKFTNLKGNTNNSIICLGDADGNMQFDIAALALFQGQGGLAIHNVAVINGEPFSASFERGGSMPLDSKLVYTVHYNSDKSYDLVTGLAEGKKKNVSQKNMVEFGIYTKTFENGAAELSIFGDVVAAEVAKKKKRVNATVKSGEEAALVYMPYDLKYSNYAEK